MSLIKTNSWFIRAKGKRPNRASLQVNPYGFHVLVMWPVDSASFEAEIRKCDKRCKLTKQQFSIGAAKFVSHHGLDYIGFNDSRPSPGFIAHETVHYAKNLLAYLGIKDEEAETYLVGHLTDTIYKLTRGRPCRA